VFGNYAATTGPEGSLVESDPAGRVLSAAVGGGDPELASARSFVFQVLARTFDYPVADVWAWLCSPGVRGGIAVAARCIEPPATGPLQTAAEALADACRPEAFDPFHEAYVTAIGHAARGACPANEIEYGDLKADPLFQPHRLADIAAFYRAFGLERGAVSDERLDHISVELEFMAVLSAQEATLLGSAPASEALAVCREAQRRFLREHLGRWTPAFTRRLQRAVTGSPLAAVAAFTLAFIESECRQAGVTAGSEDLLLRPADTAASLCDGCGLQNLPPGAVPAT